MQRIHLKNEPKLDIKLDAFPFQSEAVEAIRDLEYAAIFYEQGLGKSKIAIDLILYWLEEKMVDTILYVAKKSLLYNCEKEFKKHSYLKPKLLTQNRSNNFYVYNSPSRLILTHYEVLKTEFERLKLMLRARNVAVIFDESAKIKNPNSLLAKSAFLLSPLFKKRVIMTGTPVANRPYDIWAQIYFLDKGNSLGTDFSDFKRNADLSNELFNDKTKRTKFESFINTIFPKISSFSIRQTKDSGVIELPEKEYRTINSDWESRQYELYRQVREEMRAVVIKEGIPTEDNSSELLKRLLRLVQITSNPCLIDDSYVVAPGKFDFLIDVISSITQKKEKCIVWTSFVNNADWLTKELQQFGVTKIHGKLDMERRNRAVESFLEDQNIRVLVATPGAAKEGLTLTIANHVIYYDRTFSLDDYLQSQDRIHRISQGKKCYIYNLIMKDSIDEWIDMLLKAKHLAAQLTQGDISLEYYRSQISYEFSEIIKNILGIRGSLNSD